MISVPVLQFSALTIIFQNLLIVIDSFDLDWYSSHGHFSFSPLVLILICICHLHFSPQTITDQNLFRWCCHGQLFVTDRGIDAARMAGWQRPVCTLLVRSTYIVTVTVQCIIGTVTRGACASYDSNPQDSFSYDLNPQDSVLVSLLRILVTGSYGLERLASKQIGGDSETILGAIQSSRWLRILAHTWPENLCHLRLL